MKKSHFGSTNTRKQWSFDKSEEESDSNEPGVVLDSTSSRGDARPQHGHHAKVKASSDLSDDHIRGNLAQNIADGSQQP